MVKTECPLWGREKVLTQVQELKNLGLLFTNEGKIEWEDEKWIGALMICIDASSVPVCFCEQRAELKVEALYLPFNQRSYPQLGQELS